ncbi:hypothetical protein [uncultured Pseudodesulfovibrio sp.]|uniref:hypothetical protein n=1 Tax=uncultured Pseudodesulfovibrio sp. TaxID=2035858 RepID=UPI0029C62D0F|nr:hypothetical protein [uncultured Pseudodesulfovibrio sp.]
MSDKISSVAVVKQAVALSWRRKWTFLGLLLVGVVPSVVAMGGVAVTRSQSGAAFLLAFCVHILGMLFLVTASNHLAVTMQRGRAAVLPRPVWAAMGRVFVRGLIIVALLFAVMFVFMTPIGVLIYMYSPQGGGASLSLLPLLLIVCLVVLCYAIVMAIMLRLGIMIPAAAVGVVVKVREALALTRGHSWRMFWAMMLVALPVTVIGGIFQGVIAFSVTGGGAGAGLAIAALFLLALNLFSWIVMLVLNAVWYERLRLLASGPGAGPGNSFDFEPATSPAGPADPRAGSGVGPYADLPGE